MSLLLDAAELHGRAERAGLSGQLALADAVRSLLNAMAASKADAATLADAIRIVRAARDIVAGAPSQPGHIRAVEGQLTGLDTLSELGPFTGQLHAIAPPLRLMLDADRAEAFATYGAMHQGGPGIVHGGIIAGTFDELLGVVQRGSVRMTVDLQIRYRSVAWLGRELRYTTWVDRIEGRKAFVAGTLHDGDALCAEASAIFLAPTRPPYATSG